MGIDALSVVLGAVAGGSLTIGATIAVAKIQGDTIRGIASANRRHTRRLDLYANLFLRYADQLNLTADDRKMLYDTVTTNLNPDFLRTGER